jgi:hypothetical protein
MLTTEATETKPDALGDVACPSWCTEPPGHIVAWYDDGRYGRAHRGPKFGPYLEGCADEFTDAPGVLVYDVAFNLDEHDSVWITRPSDLLDHAAHTIAAAQWLEAHR